MLKNTGGITIYLNSKHLNKHILRSHYPFTTIYIVKTKLSNAKCSLTPYGYSGIWAIPLDAEYFKLCTFITPFERYFLCLLLGIR